MAGSEAVGLSNNGRESRSNGGSNESDVATTLLNLIVTSGFVAVGIPALSLGT
jgi:hypothetical protein